MISLLVLSTLLVASTRPVSAATLSINVDPSYLEVDIGEEKSVNINITNVEDPGLYGYDLKLYFNSTFLNCTGAVLPTGHFLTGGLEIIKEVNNTLGYIQLVVMLTGIVPGKTGSGVLANVTFSGIGIGTSSLEIKEVTLLDPEGNEIQFGTNAGVIKIVPEFASALIIFVFMTVTLAVIMLKKFNKPKYRNV